MNPTINVFFAFGAGFLSFISPCTLPLYPGFLSYITGVSTKEIQKEKGMINRQALTHTVLFLLGFSLIFIALGFSTTLIGSLFFQYSGILRKLGAILMVFFGLMVIGLLKPSFLLKDKHLSFQRRPSGFIGSFLIGIGFAAGWTPCTGPILAGVIAMGVSHPGQGFLYMVAYIFGFAVPFLILGLFTGLLKDLKRFSFVMTKIGGVIMIVMGIFLFNNWLTKLTSFLSTHLFAGFTGF